MTRKKGGTKKVSGKQVRPKKGGAKKVNARTDRKPVATVDISAMSLEDRKVYLAARFLVARKDRLLPKNLIREHLPGLKYATLMRVLRKPEHALLLKSPMRSALIAAYRQELAIGAPMTRLAMAAVELMKVGEIQGGLANYVGRYICYRVSDVPGEVIDGIIDILPADEDEVVRFTHTSMQRRNGDVSGEKVPFNHEGIVVLLSNRLYLLGMGVDSDGAYMRPMTLRAPDHPAEKPMVGTVSTETHRNEPFSSKTVLLREGLHERMMKSMGEDGFRAWLLEQLKNESKSPDIVYGWSNR